MKYFSAATRMGLIASALVFLFTLTTVATVEATQCNLISKLRKSGISMKIVRLDRTDGFSFGLSLTGSKKTIVLAPGLGRRWLIQASGNEIIMQQDEVGKMQLIQADTDITFALCIARSVVTFLSELTLCEDTDCVCTSIVSLFSNVATCADA